MKKIYINTVNKSLLVSLSLFSSFSFFFQGPNHHLKLNIAMATKRNVTSNAPVAEDISISNKAVIDEAIERNWEIPNFTIKEIRDAIPAHCFRRDTFRSFTHVLHDIIIMSILAIGASYIDSIPNTYARIALWPLYWIAQGIVGTGVWVIGHECGHQAFSPSKVHLKKRVITLFSSDTKKFFLSLSTLDH